MDFIPAGIDGPSEGVPRVLACFNNNLLRHESLKLVDGGQSQRSFVYIEDAIEAVHLMIENPTRANGHIFNVGNPNNVVIVKQLAEMMTEVYSKVSGEAALELPTIDVNSKEFYGEGYDDSDKQISDMTIINKQFGWNPKTSPWDLLESTLTYQYRTYVEAIKKENAPESCALCRNNIMDLCINCQNMKALATSTSEECNVAWGTCNHAFHLHCIKNWLETNSSCPLDDSTWTSKDGSQ